MKIRMQNTASHHHHHHHSRREARRKYRMRLIRRHAIVLGLSSIAIISTLIIFMYGVKNVPGVDTLLLRLLPVLLLFGVFVGVSYYGLSLYALRREERKE